MARLRVESSCYLLVAFWFNAHAFCCFPRFTPSAVQPHTADLNDPSAAPTSINQTKPPPPPPRPAPVIVAAPRSS
jgi:hypothetical protein